MRLTSAARRIEHGKTLLRQDRVKQHLAGFD